MFTLDSDQQIEIREQVKVILDERLSKLYWFLNTDNTAVGDTSYLCGNAASPFGTNTEYTLQEGEYLFYTNAKETDYNYYGMGTTIRIGSQTPTISRTINADDPTLADILTYGLDANIPWVTVNLEGDSKKITVEENQFLSLTEGDSLSQITLATNALNGEWQNVTSATYKLADSDSEQDLPELAVTGLSWQARSKMDFKSGPSTMQKLATTTRNGTTLKETSLEIETENHYGANKYVYNASKFDLTSQTVDTDTQKSFVFRTNYNLQNAMDTIDVEQLVKNYEELLDTYTTTDNILTEFKFRTHGFSSPEDSDDQILSLNNFGDGYTKYSFAKDANFTLRVNIPTTDATGTAVRNDDCGIVAFYYLPATADSELTVEAYSGITKTAGIWQYNTDDTLKSEFPIDSKKLVILGIHPKIDSIKISGKQKDVLIFSDLSVISGINPKLDYQGDLSALLTQIKSFDVNNKFLYNIVPNSALAIDLNNLLEDDKLSSASAFYDKNNIANKFVISEIDSNELRTGITLTKSSKL